MQLNPNPELTPEEAKKKYNREKKQESRERKRKTAVDYDDYRAEFDDNLELNNHVENFCNTVSQELSARLDPGTPIHEACWTVSWIRYALSKNWVKQVYDPKTNKILGECVAGQFPDVVGAQLESAVKNFALNRSQTFMKQYTELLGQLDKRYHRNANASDSDLAERESALSVKRERERFQS